MASGARRIPAPPLATAPEPRQPERSQTDLDRLLRRWISLDRRQPAGSTLAVRRFRCELGLPGSDRRLVCRRRLLRWEGSRRHSKWRTRFPSRGQYVDSSEGLAEFQYLGNGLWIGSKLATLTSWGKLSWTDCPACPPNPSPPGCSTRTVSRRNSRDIAVSLVPSKSA